MEGGEGFWWKALGDPEGMGAGGGEGGGY